MAHLDLLPRFFVGWGKSFVMKCIIYSSALLMKFFRSSGSTMEKAYENVAIGTYTWVFILIGQDPSLSVIIWHQSYLQGN